MTVVGDRKREKVVRQSRGRVARAFARPPFQDELGRKRWFERISRAHPHLVRRVQLEVYGWPRWSRPLRVVFLSDLHTGSHSDDVARLAGIVAEAQTFSPDLVLFGGDFVNMQVFGGGRVPPRVIAAILAELRGSIGQFAVLGNHDYTYGAEEISDALQTRGIIVLDDESQPVKFESCSIDLVGIPDAHVERIRSKDLLTGLLPGQPTIVLAHDPVWFAHIPAGPHLTLAGHTHGGQISLPGLGILRNASKAPLRWSYGLVAERGQYLYVTSGIGTTAVPLRWRVPPEFVVLDVIGPQ
jgi:predicted MPP superfamily phosphohydrolase